MCRKKTTKLKFDLDLNVPIFKCFWHIGGQWQACAVMTGRSAAASPTDLWRLSMSSKVGFHIFSPNSLVGAEIKWILIQSRYQRQYNLNILTDLWQGVSSPTDLWRLSMSLQVGFGKRNEFNLVYFFRKVLKVPDNFYLNVSIKTM